MVHFAPPCTSFSCALNRSSRTRLRSSSNPQGCVANDPRCERDNTIAVNTIWAARYVGEALGQAASVEKPHSSYLWRYVTPWAGRSFEDHVYSPCMHGDVFRKKTRVRCWNWKPTRLPRVCTRSNGWFSCGRSQQDGHPTLEFGQNSTADAAVYPPGVCYSWSQDIRDHFFEKRRVTQHA